MQKIIYLYVFDTMADWEPSYVLPELHSGRYFNDKTCKFDIKTISLAKNPITTMGGIKILPDLTIKEVRIEKAGLLILPGGDTWQDPLHAPIFEYVSRFLQQNILVAAICGATAALAAHGFLDNRKHTSNDLGYLKAICPSYKSDAHYLQQPAVMDKNLITASGLAPLDFAHMILKALEVFHPETLEAWYQLYKTQDASYFYALMGSLQK